MLSVQSCSEAMAWLTFLSMLVYLTMPVESTDHWKPFEQVDSLLLNKASMFLQSVLPLPGDTLQILGSAGGALYLPVRAEGSECQSHSQQTLESFLDRQIWAIRMVDAATKVAPGLLDGHIQDLGNYDLCVRVWEPRRLFQGQHCVVEAHGLLATQLDVYFKRMAAFDTYPGAVPVFSLCVPSSCSPNDVISHLDTTFKMAAVNVSTENFQIYCSTGRIAFRTKDWFALSVLFTIATLVALGTYYDQQTTTPKSGCRKMLSAFSVVSNWRSLKDTRVRDSDIACLNGLRVLCSFAVLVTHRVVLSRFVAVFNLTNYLEMLDDPSLALLLSGTLAVEVFFLIAGTVRCLSFLRAREGEHPPGIFQQYIRRYLRVTPPLAVLILFSSTLHFHTSDGPLWSKYMGLSELFCHYLWWANLLHITNCLGCVTVCRLETWFLAADFQLFVLSSLLLIPLSHKPRLGVMLLAAGYVTSTAVKIVDVLHKQLHPDMIIYKGPKGERTPTTADINSIYRAASYIVGLAVGYIVFLVKYRHLKITISQRVRRLLWTTCVVVLAVNFWLPTVFLRPGHEDVPWLSAFHMGIVQRLGILAVGWIVLDANLYPRGWLNKLLSWSGFVPLSKLSFGVYLTHVSFQMVQLFRLRQPVNWNAFDIVFLSVADYVISVGLAVVLYLCVEAPSDRLVRYLFEKPSSSPSPGQPKHHSLKKPDKSRRRKRD